MCLLEHWGGQQDAVELLLVDVRDERLDDHHQNNP
jgi:hypothetical protein